MVKSTTLIYTMIGFILQLLDFLSLEKTHVKYGKLKDIQKMEVLKMEVLKILTTLFTILLRINLMV